MKKLDHKQIAARVARDIPEGAYVNLGIGLPTLVADQLPKGREIILHSENGVLGLGPKPRPGQEDEDMMNAGKEPATLVTGGCYFHHADSFETHGAAGDDEHVADFQRHLVVSNAGTPPMTDCATGVGGTLRTSES